MNNLIDYNVSEKKRTAHVTYRCQKENFKDLEDNLDNKTNEKKSNKLRQAAKGFPSFT